MCYIGVESDKHCCTLRTIRAVRRNGAAETAAWIREIWAELIGDSKVRAHIESCIWNVILSYTVYRCTLLHSNQGIYLLILEVRPGNDSKEDIFTLAISEEEFIIN